MNPTDIVPNDYLTDLGTDHVAIAANGHPIGRASTREAIERACPGAAAYVTVDDLSPAAEHIVYDPAPDAEVHDETPPPVADGSAFDHDHDGRVGGGAPRTERKRKPKS